MVYPHGHAAGRIQRRPRRCCTSARSTRPRPCGATAWSWPRTRAATCRWSRWTSPRRRPRKTRSLCVRDATNKSQLPRGKQTLHPTASGTRRRAASGRRSGSRVCRRTDIPLPARDRRCLTRIRWRSPSRAKVSARSTSRASASRSPRACRRSAPVQLVSPLQFPPGAPDALPLQCDARGRHSLQLTLPCASAASRRTRTACAACFSTANAYFHNGLLDQGYWPDGLYTAPSDDALVNDIQLAKDMASNTLRKHIKVECDRW